MFTVYKLWTLVRVFRAGSAGVELVVLGRWGVVVRGGGLRRNIPRGRRPSHAAVAGSGAAVEGGWGLRGFAGW